jgi:hypothetical protein
MKILSFIKDPANKKIGLVPFYIDQDGTVMPVQCLDPGHVISYLVRVDISFFSGVEGGVESRNKKVADLFKAYTEGKYPFHVKEYTAEEYQKKYEGSKLYGFGEE